MPNLKINTDNCVLVEVPKGKFYLGDNETRHVQKAQQGQTCWFYSLQVIRPVRYGNQYEGNEFRQKRKEEKAISEHRKRLESMDFEALFEEGLLMSLQSFYGDIEFKNEHVQGYINFLNSPEFIQKLTQKDSEYKENILIYLNNYLKRTEDQKVLTLNQFIQKKEEERLDKRIQSAKKVFEDADVYVGEYLTNVVENLDDIEVTDLKKEEFSIYQKAVQHFAADSYGLKPLEWNPLEGLTSLMILIKKHGAFYVSGKFGLPWIDTPKRTLHTNKEGETVSLIPDNSYKSSASPGHTIVIVGVEMENKLVYFIDPNEDSNERNVYAMSYNYFSNSIVDIYGVFYNNQNTQRKKFDRLLPGPYGFFCPYSVSNNDNAIPEETNTSSQDVNTSFNNSNA